jgi:hypothetical protein
MDVSQRVPSDVAPVSFCAAVLIGVHDVNQPTLILCLKNRQA